MGDVTAEDRLKEIQQKQNRIVDSMDLKLSCAIFFLPILATLASLATADNCIQNVCNNKDFCSCVMDSEEVDLSPMKQMEWLTATSPFATFYFNPCRNITHKKCKDALLCEDSTLTGVSTIGLTSNAIFEKCGEDLVLKYTHGSPKRTGVVTLKCDPNLTATLINTKNTALPLLPKEYDFELRSKFACLKSLQTSTTKKTSPTTTPKKTSPTTTPKKTTPTTTPK